jgi:hypothetical protein
MEAIVLEALFGWAGTRLNGACDADWEGDRVPLGSEESEPWGDAFGRR